MDDTGYFLIASATKSGGRQRVRSAWPSQIMSCRCRLKDPERRWLRDIACGPAEDDSPRKAGEPARRARASDSRCSGCSTRRRDLLGKDRRVAWNLRAGRTATIRNGCRTGVIADPVTRPRTFVPLGANRVGGRYDAYQVIGAGEDSRYPAFRLGATGSYWWLDQCDPSDCCTAVRAGGGGTSRGGRPDRGHAGAWQHRWRRRATSG